MFALLLSLFKFTFLPKILDFCCNNVDRRERSNVPSRFVIFVTICNSCNMDVYVCVCVCVCVVVCGGCVRECSVRCGVYLQCALEKVPLIIMRALCCCRCCCRLLLLLLLVRIFCGYF